MVFADGQRFGKIQVKKVGKHSQQAKDPKAKVPAKLKALLPSGPEAFTSMPSYDFAYTIVSEPAKGKKSDDSTPERLYWVHRGKLVSSKDTFVALRSLVATPESGHGLFVAKPGLFEVDLETGDAQNLTLGGWSEKRPPNYGTYLTDDRALVCNSTIALGKRIGSKIALDSPLEITTEGLSGIEGRVFFSSGERSLVLGHSEGVVRILADLGVWGAYPWLAAKQTLRFYVAPFQNEALPAESCGTFELTGSLDAWDHCFNKGHEKDYLAVKQKSGSKR